MQIRINGVVLLLHRLKDMVLLHLDTALIGDLGKMPTSQTDCILGMVLSSYHSLRRGSAYPLALLLLVHPLFSHVIFSFGHAWKCSGASMYTPSQSQPSLRHSTGSCLVTFSRAMLTPENCLRHNGHVGTAFRLAKSVIQSRHPECPRVKLTGFTTVP